MANHNDLGSQGEQQAVDFLIKNGYQILERNWRYKHAEIDIIALKHDQLIVVEVKTRSEGFVIDPIQAVSKKKIQLLITAINSYVDKRSIDSEIRFDIISVIKAKSTFHIEHIEDAFYFF